jgi:1-deoxy-D-xylulose-5-phosphate synthase
MVETCREVAENLDATLIDMRFIKPLDREAVVGAAREHDTLVTVEENAVAGGAGSAVNELLAAAGIGAPVLNLGLDDSFLPHGTRDECLRMAGLDAEGIQARIVRFAGGRPPASVQESAIR